MFGELSEEEKLNLPNHELKYTKVLLVNEKAVDFFHGNLMEKI